MEYAPFGMTEWAYALAADVLCLADRVEAADQTIAEMNDSTDLGIVRLRRAIAAFLFAHDEMYRSMVEHEAGDGDRRALCDEQERRAVSSLRAALSSPPPTEP